MIVPDAGGTSPTEDDGHEQWTAEVMDLARKMGRSRWPSSEHCGGPPGSRRRSGVYADRFDRLRELKREWDPDNVFSGNHNVPPTRLHSDEGVY